MPISVGLIYELIFVVILVLTALHGRRQGLVAGLVSLAGAVVGVAASVWAAGQMAPAIWQQHVGAAVSQGVADAVTAQGETLTQALNQYLGFLPASLLEQVAEAIQQALNNAGADIAAEVMLQLEPILLPLLQAVIFLILCSVIRWLFRLAAGLLRHLNDLPLVGGVNKALGTVLGLVTGLLDCWMLSLLIWGGMALSGGSVAWLSQEAVSGSVLYSLFAGLNPFLA